jgi:hypothetical protein
MYVVDTDIEAKRLCIITKTGEEKELYPVYDDSIKTGLNVADSARGIGKFVGWKDIDTDTFYKPREGAYIKPAEPYELFGIECGDGWKDLIAPIFEWIKNYNNEHPNKIEIQQVKEKFGGLRFYVSCYPDELQRMITKAEGDSYGICEVCGSKEDVGHTQGWIRTICRKCIEDEMKHSKHKKQIKWVSKDTGLVHFITNEEIDEMRI